MSDERQIGSIIVEKIPGGHLRISPAEEGGFAARTLGNSQTIISAVIIKRADVESLRLLLKEWETM